MTLTNHRTANLVACEKAGEGWTKGADHTMIFDRDEYHRRVAETKRLMAERGMDLLITCDPANMNYLTGYDGWSFYVPQAVLLQISDNMPIWVGRGQDQPGAQLTTWLDDDHICSYPDSYVQASDKHPMEFVAELLAARGWNKGSVGIDMDGFYVTPRGYEALKARFPTGAISDSAKLVNWVRAVKSEHEIAVMLEAAQILERTMSVAISGIAPGVRQCDLVAAILSAQTAGTPEFGGDYTAIVPLLPTGAQLHAPHLTWSDAKFASGEATMVEIAGCRHRYHSPMARTIFLGKPPVKLVEMSHAFVEALENTMVAARVGATCEDVEAAWRTSIAKAGITQTWRIGYSVGVNYPPDWGEGTMSLRPGDTTVLKQNMVFHLIPSVIVDEYRIEISECVRVTETGGEALAQIPRQLIVKH